MLQSIFLENDSSLYGQIDRKDGWVVLERSGNLARLATRDRADAQKTIAKLEKEIADQDRKITDNEDTPTVTDAHLALAKLRERLIDRQNRLAKLPQVDPPSPIEAEPVIREAYLRALGRGPTETELARTSEHFRQAATKVKAMRDLLWALLNTKEFTTNH